ncbi:MAG: MFS transporter, partial [Firmicutes bacterium]|nr:MFS transporter [Bacillota bacterium]
PRSDQRARASQYADIGSMLGGLLPALTMPMLSGGGAFGLNQQQVYLMFAVVLCLGGGFQSLFAMGMNERVRSLPAPGGGKKAHVLGDLWQNLADLRHNHIILLLLASEVLSALAPNVTDIYIYQQLSYQIGGRTISAGLLVTIFSAAALLPGGVLKFFATKIAARVGGMKRIIVIARIASVVTGVLGFLVGIKSVWALALVQLIDGFSNLPGSLNSIAWRALVGDSVDYVEWKIGKRTEGITMSVRNLMAKLGNALKRLIQGYTLKFLQFDAALVPKGLPQNAHFRRWIWPAFRLGPVLGMVLSLVPLLLLKYPESLRHQVEEEMAQRRALAEACEASEAIHD